MRVLNLYAGIGGNRKLWEDVEVTAVELNEKIANVYSANFPNDTVIIGDAHKYLLEYYDEFDFAWLSPPCQKESRMVKATRHTKKHYPNLSIYQEIIFLEHFFEGKWVVENVVPYYKPLIPPTKILGRHCFWSNFRIGEYDVANHPNFIQADSKEEIESMKKWIGIEYDGNIYYDGNHSPGQILRNCVHPEVGLHILNCALKIYNNPKPEQISLWL